MSTAINDIKNKVSKLRSLTGVDFCSMVEALSNDATEQQYINAWNIDASIIAGMINDMELLATQIDTEDYE